MERLYNEYEALNSTGNSLTDKAESALRPIVAAAMDDGIDGRDILSALVMVITSIVAESVLIRATKRRKQSRECGL